VTKATRNKQQGTEEADSSADAGTQREEAATLKVKPKPRKKKPAEVSAEPAAPAETATPEVQAKPAKKAAAKKAAAKKAKAAAEAEESPAEPAEKKPKARKTAATKDKGRDLVVDEPGAREVADVLSHSAPEPEQDEEPEAEPQQAAPGESAGLDRPAPKLERLQKILAKAGISSRRKAEELILGGLVQINGKVVMELGTKADPSRDHVRVDGKLLQGPERIRYFVLNKPKGYVTTVSDPEGRPTVMQFFAGERERLYPVGRLDYLSEGLLLVTNDGELANKLTKASSGVEKTYLVKVAGQPSEEGLDTLRAGVVIERGRGVGSGRVRTAPAKIRQVRQGDNPWYEVIVIEGRNRELRKMFEEIGHHVEKIRRIGYGPLILDLEPGKLRELEAEEVHSLRLASEGKLKTRRRRGPAPAQLPTVAGKTVRYKKADGKPGFEPRTRLVPRPEFQTESKSEFNPEFRSIPKASFKPKSSFQPGAKPEFRAETRSGAKPAFKSASKPGFKSGARPAFGAGSRTGGKPEFGGRGNFAAKPRRVEPPVTDYVLPPRKSGPTDSDLEDRPAHQGKGFNPDYKPGFRTGGKPAFGSEGRPGARPGGKPEFRKDRPAKNFGVDRDSERDRKPFRPAAPRSEFKRPAEPVDDADFAPRKTPGFRIEPVEDQPRGERPQRPNSGTARPFRPASGRPATGRPSLGRPALAGSVSGRPPVGNRPLQPRTDRPAPAAKPFRPRPAEGRGPASSGDRPFRPRREFGSDSAPRPGSRPSPEGRPARFTPRTDGPPARGRKPFTGTASREDRPREFRPRAGSAPPKKFSGARPTGPAKTGPEGEPRKKERWRNSFTGKNKGRPKPKPKKDG
jgi:23S rRNA pseudouridine2605 synthase